MNKSNFKFFFLSLAVISSIFYSSVSLAAEDPVNMLQSLASQLTDQLKQNQASIKTNRELVFSLADKIIIPHADIDEMAKRVLPPSTWKSATVGNKAEFKKQFTKVLVNTYASALAEYKDQTIKFSPLRGGAAGKDNIEISSRILRSDAPAIVVKYRLILKGNQWKVYDLNVEGISLLESFRSQFSDQLAQGNLNSLIAKLVQHNNEVAKNS